MFRSIVCAAVAALALAPFGALAAEPSAGQTSQGPPTAQRQGIAVPPEVLARYVGRYRIRPEVEAEITLDGGKLYGALSGRPKHELLAETPTRFFATDVNAQIVFEPGPDGRASSLVLTIDGQVAEAQRVSDPGAS